jgi:hypothetical protein
MSTIPMATKSGTPVDDEIDVSPSKGSLRAAVHALLGHHAITVVGSFSEALTRAQADPQTDDLFLWSGKYVGDEVGRYWITGLFRCSDLPEIIEEVAQKKGLSPSDARDRVATFAAGLTSARVARTPCATAEIDHLTRGEQERRYAALAAATGLEWTLLVFSGGKSIHGFMAYDRLLDPTDPLRLEIQRLLVVVLEGDSRIVDARREMRLPGWDSPRRKQPIVHIDPTARYSPEVIRDRLRAYAVSMDIADVDAAYQDLQLAEQLDIEGNHQIADAALELHEHAGVIRRERGAVSDQNRDLAHAMLGRRCPVTSHQSVSVTTGSCGDVLRVAAADIEPFRGLAPWTRVDAPCCAGRGGGDAVVMHQPGEVPRLWCHRHRHTVLTEVGVVSFGFSGCTTLPNKKKEGGATDIDKGCTTAPKKKEDGAATGDASGCTTPPKKKKEGGATSIRYVKVNARHLTDALPDPLGEFGEEGGILLIRSTQETGKTYLAGVISKTCAARWPEEAQVAPTHRVALVLNHAGRLDFGTYDIDPTADKVATTLDSVAKVPTYKVGKGGMLTDRHFSLVFLDEVAQLFRHAVGGTIGADAPRVLNHLRAIFASTRFIVAGDADADDDTLEILQMLAPGRRVVVVDNDWRPTDRGAVMYESRSGHLADFVDDVAADLRVAYMTCGGPKRASAVVEMAKKTRPGIATRVYSQDTSKLHEVQDELADISNATAKYVVVVATPTLGSGVDIQDMGFDRIYLDVPAHDVGADEAVQLGFRVRNPKDRVWRVWADARKRSRETIPGAIRAELLNIRKQTEGTIAKKYANSPTVKLVTALEMSPVDELHMDLYCRARAHIHAFTNDLRKAMVARLVEAGFAVTDAGAVDPATAKQVGEDFAAAKLDTTTERASRVAKSMDIPTEEADRIARARKATQEELDAAERANIRDFYDRDVDEALVVEDDRGNLRPRIGLLAIYLLARKRDHATALVGDVQRLRQGLTARIRGQYIAAKLLTRLLSLFGVTGDVEAHQQAVAPVPGFTGKVKVLLPLIKRYIGVTHRPKTKTVDGKMLRLADIDSIALLSQVLRRFGLGLASKAIKRDGKAVRVYQIDASLARHRIELSRAAVGRLRDALARLEAEARYESERDAHRMTPEQEAEMDAALDLLDAA